MREKKLKVIEEKLFEVVEESKLLGLNYKEVEEMLRFYLRRYNDGLRFGGQQFKKRI